MNSTTYPIWLQNSYLKRQSPEGVVAISTNHSLTFFAANYKDHKNRTEKVYRRLVEYIYKINSKNGCHLGIISRIP